MQIKKLVQLKTVPISKALLSQFGLSQLINEANHILESSSPCIDLIFITQPNLAVESGVHPFLNPNYHHQIIFAKVNYKCITHHHTHEKTYQTGNY